MINVLAKASPKMRKAILEQADKPLIQTLTESVCNVTSGNIPIKPCLRKSLRKYKVQLRAIACPQTRWKSKKKVFVQKGGFLPLLLPVVSAALSGLVTRLLSK